ISVFAVLCPGGLLPVCASSVAGSPKLLGATQLRYPLEMTISRNQNQLVFQYQRCNPKIIVRDRRARSPELNENPRIVLRGFPAGQQDSNGRFGQQLG